MNIRYFFLNFTISNRKKQFNCSKYRIILMFFNFMDTTFMKQCITLLELLWSVNTWRADKILSIYSEKESKQDYFGSKKNSKKC